MSAYRIRGIAKRPSTNKTVHPTRHLSTVTRLVGGVEFAQARTALLTAHIPVDCEIGDFQMQDRAKTLVINMSAEKHPSHRAMHTFQIAKIIRFFDIAQKKRIFFLISTKIYFFLPFHENNSHYMPAQLVTMQVF